jgi:hypothetical protein
MVSSEDPTLVSSVRIPLLPLLLGTGDIVGWFRMTSSRESGVSFGAMAGRSGAPELLLSVAFQRAPTESSDLTASALEADLLERARLLQTMKRFWCASFSFIFL